MHIPVFLCGLLCGWRYGLFIGFSLPLLRGMVFGMPIVYPTGLAMAFELATYGIVVGYLYERSHKQGIRALYCALLSAMVIGRVVWGCIEVMLLGVGGKLFTWELFIASAFVQAIPGILLQLVPVSYTHLDVYKRQGIYRRQTDRAPTGSKESFLAYGIFLWTAYCFFDLF